MKIAIDATRAVIEQAGIGRYSSEVIKNIIAAGADDEFLVYSTHYHDSAEKTAKFNAFRATNVRLVRVRIPGAFKELMWSLPVDWFYRMLKDQDVLFAPSHLEIMRGAKIPQVMAVHDLTVALFPAQRGTKVSAKLKKNLFDGALKAAKVVAISKSTAHDLIKFLPAVKDKVSVVYPAGGELKDEGVALPAKLNNERYILSVGTIEPRKNLIGLMRAYAQLAAELRDKFPLVLVGGKGWNDGVIFEEFKRMGIARNVIFTGFVTDGELASLYKHCKVFAYISTYEGFGLPVVEAMSFGRPVITSNVSSMPEAAGQAGELVEPDDYVGVAKKLTEMLQDKNLNEKYAARAIAQAKKFNWAQAGRETLGIIKSSK